MNEEERMTFKLDVITMPLCQFIRKYKNIIIEDGKVVSAELI